MKKFLKDNLFLILIIMVGFLLRIYAINWQLPYLYQTEEYKTVNYTLKMAAQKNLNPKFFEYPSLYLYFMLIVFTMTFIIGKMLGVYNTTEQFAIDFLKDPSVVYTVARTFSALFGTAVVVATYFLGWKLYNKRIGIISALMLSVLPIWVRYSHFIKPEMASNFLVVMYVIMLYNYYISSNSKYFYLSSIFLGLATSMKYLSFPASIGLVVVTLLKNRKIDKILFLGFLLIGVFFVVGTPYSILDFPTFLKEIKGIVIGPQQGLTRNLLVGVAVTIKDYIFMGNRTPIIGGICFLGCVWLAFTKLRIQEILLLSIVIIYFLINATHYLPAWGFLFTAFPFYAIIGARFIDELCNKYKSFFWIFAFLMIIPFVESICENITFSLKDTRTLALEWIEKNLPYGSKILIDRYPNSPPLKMTKAQLERLYKKAVELNHYKKEYFYWQLKSHPGENYGYEIYEVEHPAYEIGTIKHQVEEAQKVRELIDVSKGVEYIKNFGIRYIILNSFSETESTKSFYKEVDQKAKILQEFKPKTKLHPGPVIKIYEVK